jgi:hypothetical protein
MQNINPLYILIIYIVLLLASFAWYYVTLPGSKLSPIKDHPEPTIGKAAISYLLYIIPMVVVKIYVMSKVKLY